jgi:chitinase
MKSVRRTALLCFLIAMVFAPKLLAQSSTGNGGPMKIVGYFPRWGMYSSYFVKNLITSGAAPVLTHLDYAFTNVVNNRCVSFDTYADYQATFTAAHAVKVAW